MEAAVKGPEQTELNSESQALLDKLGQELKPIGDDEIYGVRHFLVGN